jgi:hypothetical protein
MRASFQPQGTTRVSERRRLSQVSCEPGVRQSFPLASEQAVEPGGSVVHRSPWNRNAFPSQSWRSLRHDQTLDRLAAGGEIVEACVHQLAAGQAEFFETVRAEPNPHPSSKRRMSCNRNARIRRHALRARPASGPAMGTKLLADPSRESHRGLNLPRG